MGVVSIPDSPTAPRFTALRAELDQDELRTVVHLMRGALEHALGGSSVSGAAPALAAAAAVAIPSNGVRAASEPRAHSSAPASAHPAPSPYSAPVAPAPMPLHQPMPQAYSHAPHVPPPVPAPFFPAPAAQFLAPAALQYPPTAQYQPAPMDMYNNVPVPAAAPAFVPRTAPPPPPRQQQPRPAPAAPAAPRIQFSNKFPAPSGSRRWMNIWTTSEAEHGHNAVHSALYSQTFPGLPSGDGHAGWLISASDGMMNLWECSGSGGSGGEPSLQVMHSQSTDLNVRSMSHDARANLLLCTGAEAIRRVNIHSLDAETGFLDPRGVVTLQEQQGTSRTSKGNKSMPPSTVVSLSTLGGPLGSSFAVSYGTQMQVYDLEKLGGAPRTAWNAHAADVTAVCCMRAPAVALLTAASNGTIGYWDLRKKPTKPAMSWSQPPADGKTASRLQGISALRMVSDCTFMSATEDGQLTLWDVKTAAPLSTVRPTKKPVVHAAMAPLHDCCAVVTPDALRCVPLLPDGLFQGNQACTTTAPRAFLDCVWNSKTGELYATAADGSLAVFRDCPV